MHTHEIEFFLAKLYTDEALLKRFVENPSAALVGYGLSEESIGYLLQINLQDLMLAARSYSHKRSQYTRRQGIFEKLHNLIFAPRQK